MAKERTEKMKAVRLHAKWEPRPGFKLGAKEPQKS